MDEVYHLSFQLIREVKAKNVWADHAEEGKVWTKVIVFEDVLQHVAVNNYAEVFQQVIHCLTELHRRSDGPASGIALL